MNSDVKWRKALPRTNGIKHCRCGVTGEEFIAIWSNTERRFLTVEGAPIVFGTRNVEGDVWKSIKKLSIKNAKLRCSVGVEMLVSAATNIVNAAVIGEASIEGISLRQLYELREALLLIQKLYGANNQAHDNRSMHKVMRS